MGDDANNWDENVYRECLLKERRIQTRTVFRTAWAPSPLNPNHHSLVVASSDSSVASYSIPSYISNLKNNTDAYADYWLDQIASFKGMMDLHMMSNSMVMVKMLCC
ncbi:hypothetical protein PIB30_036134 [Stylosanthes scabra]|uniref:Uncharacterized protein n=1 Tax=Stylosanthes scabra TaxID=79078 RepID=A0ABU6WFD1_9FABA|nr:hypothetical protein [Stylosanthes scabra]